MNLHYFNIIFVIPFISQENFPLVVKSRLSKLIKMV